MEVNPNNENPVERAVFKSYYDLKGVYVFATVYDKVYSRNNDNIWLNDGIEFMIDTAYTSSSDSVLKDGMYRFGLDVDNGLESDMYLKGYSNPIPYYMKTNSKVTINRIDEYTDYGYKYARTVSINITETKIQIANFSNIFDFKKISTYIEKTILNTNENLSIPGMSK
jgi:hypothetical protein